MCKFSALDLPFDERVLRGFQKGMTLGIRPSGSACKVAGGVAGWWGGEVALSIIVSPQVQSLTLDFGLGL